MVAVIFICGYDAWSHCSHLLAMKKGPSTQKMGRKKEEKSIRSKMSTSRPPKLIIISIW